MSAGVPSTLSDMTSSTVIPSESTPVAAAPPQSPEQEHGPLDPPPDVVPAEPMRAPADQR